MSDVFRNARRLFSRIKPVRVPEAPARSFRDLWPGDANRGAALLRGEMEVLGSTRMLDGWGPESGPLLWRQAAHGFAWLRDLRSLGSDAARVEARDLTEAWLAQGANEPLANLPEVAAARVSAWLGHWDFFAASAEEGFRRALMQRLAHDGRRLAASLPDEAAHRGALMVLKGTIAAAVALGEEAWMVRALKFLPAELERQFHPDGGHVERSPAVQLLAFQDLIELRNLLNGSGVTAPPQLATVIDRAGQALRLFRHGDGTLALFNGTREEPASLVDLVLTQGQAKGRAPLLLQETGFHRLAASRTLVIADCGAPPPGRGADPATGAPRGADRFAHAGALSFEMSVGRDRLIVNCGASPAGDPAWRDALRSTAAHSTLTLADTNSAELRPEGLGRRPERVEVERFEANGAQWLEATHDGYRRTHNAIHKRRLYLSENGDDLRGEDVLEPQGTVDQPCVVRFHLHPGVKAVLQEEEGGVLMRLPTGQGWRLRARGAAIALEDSVYLGLGVEARRTSQIVLTSQGEPEGIQWAITRVAPAEPASPPA
ncbi:heparinase II/III family protein [Roseococcus suduntuyensis]|uniref:Putative heparinase superfamily protein n=1 Tax=Roseococcus suduntuyensis TaxID=455361 RepID=A0A840A861_9PROT|nr:heparinase II/III family protein [Roseococcus suduntuyensis]MBB3897709.1 putative heparinase superfamily protein [Roseococcus suduntuyensis]